MPATLFADVDRHPSPALSRFLDERREVAVRIGRVLVRPRAGDVDSNHPARRVADRLLDDDRVLRR